jgi:hypothetical protein
MTPVSSNGTSIDYYFTADAQIEGYSLMNNFETGGGKTLQPFGVKIAMSSILEKDPAFIRLAIIY